MEKVNVTPDGMYYLAMAKQRVAMPFHLRWLLPMLLKDRVKAWLWTSRVSVIGIGVLTAWYCKNPWMFCVALLPGVNFSWRFPVLVDATAMFLALLAAVLAPINIYAAILVAVIAACVKETAFVWASVYAWNPILLIGFIPVVLRKMIRHGSYKLQGHGDYSIKNALRSVKQERIGAWLNPALLILPWGALILGVGHMSLQLIVSMIIGYGQLIVASDSVRLYQWAAPVLALACVAAVPPEWLPLVAIFVAFNPFKGSGL